MLTLPKTVISGVAGVVIGILVTLFINKMSSREDNREDELPKRPKLEVEPQVSQVQAVNPKIQQSVSEVMTVTVPFPDEERWFDPIPHKDIWHVCSESCSEFKGNDAPRRSKGKGRVTRRESKWEKW